jgi:hypothetical protein
MAPKSNKYTKIDYLKINLILIITKVGKAGRQKLI